MGQISENDLLQLELNKLNAQSSMTNCESDYQAAMFKLRSFLDLDESVNLEPVVPEDIPEALITYGDVIEKAHANNYFTKNIRRRQLEAEYSVAKAKGNRREITMFAQIGYTGTADEFRSAYDKLKDNQVLEMCIRDRMSEGWIMTTLAWIIGCGLYCIYAKKHGLYEAEGVFWGHSRCV